jgi:hypothetical protein
MKNNAFVVTVLFIIVLFTTPLMASNIDQELDRVAGEVAGLKLGFGEYILGSSLNDSQKELASQASVDKAMEGTYKFQDGELFVVASSENDTILGIYKQFPETTREQMKAIVGDLMLNYGEPTAMAHGKLVYWTYNTSGKISQDEFDFARQSGGAESLVTVKLSSSEAIFSQDDQDAKAEADRTALSIYVMITSDPLSKLFLAKNSSSKKTNN